MKVGALLFLVGFVAALGPPDKKDKRRHPSDNEHAPKPVLDVDSKGRATHVHVRSEAQISSFADELPVSI